MTSSELINLVRDLHKLNNDNKVFLASHLGLTDTETLAEPYRKAIRREFNPDRGFPRLNIGAARKALNGFKKASADPKAIADMMIYYVEQGVICTLNYGDIDEAFYSSLEGVFEDVINLIPRVGNVEVVEQFRPRLKRIVSDTGGIGWGFHDFWPMYITINTHLNE